MRTVILFQPKTFRGMKAYTPPLGLIMSAVQVCRTYRVMIIDQSVESDWKERLTELLLGNPLCLGITTMTGSQIPRALAAAQLAKEHGCPVVWGGVHPSLLPEQTLSHPLADYVVAGEGEDAFAELVGALDHGMDVRAIAGVWSKQNGTASYGGERPFADLESLPEIPYHLVNLERYMRPGPFGAALSLYSSRGCPRKCRFCYNSAYHHGQWRAFSAERTLGDIRRIRELCPKLEHIALWDDAFFPDLTRAQLIAEGIAKITPRLSWSVLGAHVRDVVRMSDEYLRTLKESGLTDAVVGVESGSAPIIEALQKNFRLDQLFDANRRLGKSGIRPTYTFMSGIPGETDDDIRKTVDVMFRLKRENPSAVLGNVKPFVPYPGTGFYDMALARGFKPPERLEDWSRFVWGNYAKLDIPWTDKKRRAWLNCLYFYTVALNPEYLFINSRLFSVLARLMLPITRWRVRHLCFRLPLAARVMALAERVFM
jgi:radical SAM superfamily enzyme YgiQ (UPF0313 family)